MVGRLIFRRMAFGGVLLGLYGVWVACARLPGELTLGTRTLSSIWAVAVFAAAGMAVAGMVAAAVSALSWPIRGQRRAAVAAVVETALLLPLIAWLALNEAVYATTSEVLGYDTFAMVWNNPAATFEAAWEMGAKYLIGVAVLTLVCAGAIFWLSRRSFRGESRLASRDSRVDARNDGVLTRYALLATRYSAMTGGLVIVACLLTWQFYARPSEALTVLFRSAPPLRALNLTRALIGQELKTTHVQTGPHVALITDAEYQQQIGAIRRPQPNVILIVLESVPAKALHCYGYARADVSPNMDALAAQGVLFEHCLSTASFSSYGLVSVMTSLYLLRAENNDHFRDTSFPFMSLPRALKLAGYETTLFSSGNETFDHINHFCRPEDFDHYYCHETSGVQHSDCMRMDDRFALGEFEKWIGTRRPAGAPAATKPFYCSFYLQATHFNYETPEPWASYYKPTPTLFGNGDGIIMIPPDVLPLLRNQYDNAMRYSDHWVGKIRAALEQTGQLDNTIIAIIGDHGEGFMEHGLARHGVSTWEEMIHVPLIVYVGKTIRKSNGYELPSRVPGTVSGIDVVPTLTGMAGIDPHPSWQGVNVLGKGYTSRDRPIFSVLQLTRWQEVACINRLKYMYDLTEVLPRLFDLNSDPDERNDLVQQRTDLAAAMRELLAGWNTQQLSYYAWSHRPFTHYNGRYEPDADVLKRIHIAADVAGVKN